jgi:hypothetical protein
MASPATVAAARPMTADAGDFDLQAAVLGMVVFADFVGEIDDGARLCRRSSDRRGGPGSSRWPSWGRGDCLAEFEPDVLFLHEANGRGEAQIAVRGRPVRDCRGRGLEFA